MALVEEKLAVGPVADGASTAQINIIDIEVVAIIIGRHNA